MGVLLLIGLSIPAVTDFISTGNLPELLGIGSVATAGLMFAPLGFPEIERPDKPTALQLKEKRGTIHLKLVGMNQLAKDEKRDFTRDEEKQWNELTKEFALLGFDVAKAEDEEKRAAETAGNNFMRKNGVGPGEKWMDTRSGSLINVVSRDENFADTVAPENRSNFSLGKVIRGMVTGKMDLNETESRALSTAPGSGAVLVPIEYVPNIIDAVRNKAVCFKAGAKLVPMSSESMTIARVTGDPAFEVKAQNIPFGEGTMTFDGISLTAKTLGTIVYLSRELASDAPNIISAIETALINAIAVEIDRYALLGEGTTEPLGLNNILGTKAIDLESSATLGYDSLIKAWGELAGESAEPTAYIVNPRDLTAMMLERTTNGYLVAPTILNDKILHTAAMPSNLGTTTDESVAFAGDFKKMYIGMREGLMIEVTTTAGDTFAKHSVGIKITARFDVAFERANHFAKIVNISAPA